MNATATAARSAEAEAADRAALEAIRADDGAESLREWAYDSHKDFTGMKGRWAVRAPIAEVIDWLVAHFTRGPDGIWQPLHSFPED